MAKAVRDLVSEVSRALHVGEFESACRAVSALESIDPSDPGLPSQRAQICRAMNDQSGELRALIRCAELHTDAGQVIPAIATCKRILSIDPEHSETQRRLELLYLDGATAAEPSRDPEEAIFNEKAPLAELTLTQALPGGQILELEDVAEIPLDPDSSFELESNAVLAFEQSNGNLGPIEAPELSPRQTLLETPLFGALDASSMRKLIDTLELVELSEGELLFRQGDPAGPLYVVAQGAVVAIAEGSPRKKLAVLEEGEFFGEIGLVTNEARNATIEALVETRLLALDRSVMWELIRAEPSVSKVILAFLRERLVDRMARTSKLFSSFAPTERAAVARQFRLLEVKDEGVLIEQHRPAGGLFILLSGQMSVIYMDADGDKELASLRPGNIFGEMSLLSGGDTAAAVVANGKCWVLSLSAKRFRNLIGRHPELRQTLAELAAKRESANRETLRNSGGLQGERPGKI